MSNLREIKPVYIEANEKLQRVLTELLESIKGEDWIAGAFTVWDRRGGAYTVIDAVEGPVHMCMVPMFVHDALNRHVAVDLAQTVTSEPIGMDDA